MVTFKVGDFVGVSSVPGSNFRGTTGTVLRVDKKTALVLIDAGRYTLPFGRLSLRTPIVEEGEDYSDWSKVRLGCEMVRRGMVGQSSFLRKKAWNPEKKKWEGVPDYGPEGLGRFTREKMIRLLTGEDTKLADE